MDKDLLNLHGVVGNTEGSGKQQLDRLFGTSDQLTDALVEDLWLPRLVFSVRILSLELEPITDSPVHHPVVLVLTCSSSTTLDYHLCPWWKAKYRSRRHPHELVRIDTEGIVVSNQRIEIQLILGVVEDPITNRERRSRSKWLEGRIEKWFLIQVQRRRFLRLLVVPGYVWRIHLRITIVR